MIIKLKASGSFIQLFSSVKRAKAIVLCEGSRDVEIPAKIIEKLGLSRFEGIAVTGSDGINTLKGDVLLAILSLIIGKAASKPKPVAVVVDANRKSPVDITNEIKNGLTLRKYDVTEEKQACINTWMLRS